MGKRASQHKTTLLSEPYIWMVKVFKRIFNAPLVCLHCIYNYIGKSSLTNTKLQAIMSRFQAVAPTLALEAVTFVISKRGRRLVNSRPSQNNATPRNSNSSINPWPLIDSASPNPPEIDWKALNKALDGAFREEDPHSPKRTRAVVVVQDGWVMAERYAKGVKPDAPLRGWSMSKSVAHAVIGRAIQEGLFDPNHPPIVPEWSDPQDPRHEISVNQLLRMRSGLAFEESGELNSDLLQMLQKKDMAHYAASKPMDKPPRKKWKYTSGPTNILSRMLRHAIDNDELYWKFPSQELFERLGMTSAVFETDKSGTFVGSSGVLASGQDWARFGQLYLDHGKWNGEQLLPLKWVKEARRSTHGSRKKYGAHWWLSSRKSRPDLPNDSYSAEGFQGQLLLIAPSQCAVIVRLGQTPKRGGFDKNAFGAQVLLALRRGKPEKFSSQPRRTSHKHRNKEGEAKKSRDSVT